MSEKNLIINRKARHEYEIHEKFEAGIALVGTEVKSLRAGKANITDAYCHITGNLELELLQLHISQYSHGNIHNHDPNRTRKLLMHKREIGKLLSKVKEKGLTLIPTRIYIKRSYIKVEISLCRGKKLHDKRASLKEKDAKREISQVL